MESPTSCRSFCSGNQRNIQGHLPLMVILGVSNTRTWASAHMILDIWEMTCIYPKLTLFIISLFLSYFSSLQLHFLFFSKSYVLTCVLWYAPLDFGHVLLKWFTHGALCLKSGSRLPDDHHILVAIILWLIQHLNGRICATGKTGGKLPILEDG